MVEGGFGIEKFSVKLSQMRLDSALNCHYVVNFVLVREMKQLPGLIFLSDSLFQVRLHGLHSAVLLFEGKLIHRYVFETV